MHNYSFLFLIKIYYKNFLMSFIRHLKYKNYCDTYFFKCIKNNIVFNPTMQFRKKRIRTSDSIMLLSLQLNPQTNKRTLP
jgi:hypothetical protein